MVNPMADTTEGWKIGLHAAGIVILALGVVGGASLWAVETPAAAELRLLQQRVVSLEEANRRAAKAAEETQAGIARLEMQNAQYPEALDWIKKVLQRLEKTAHSHTERE